MNIKPVSKANQKCTSTKGRQDFDMLSLHYPCNNVHIHLRGFQQVGMYLIRSEACLMTWNVRRVGLQACCSLQFGLQQHLWPWKRPAELHTTTGTIQTCNTAANPHISCLTLGVVLLLSTMSEQTSRRMMCCETRSMCTWCCTSCS